jgi:hypothetical protein
MADGSREGTPARDAARLARLEHLAPWLTGALLAAPVLWAFYPPMSDLPYHEAGIGLLRHLGDPAFEPPGLYELNLGEPNQLFHMLGWALSYVVSTRWAVKLLVAAIVLVLPPCAARLSRHAGSSPLAALLVAPMALGWLFSCGFVANLAGLAALLAMLPALDRLGAEPTPRRALATLGALVLLYFAHMAMMMAFAAAALGLTLLYPWSWRKSPWRLFPLAAGLAITLAQTQWQKRYMTPAVSELPRLWEPLSRKLLLVPYLVLPTSEAAVQAAVTLLCAASVGTLVWMRARERRAATDRGAGGAPEAGATGSERARRWARAHRWELFAAAGFVAYLTFPLTLNGAMLVYQRWLAPAFAVLVACAAPRDLRAKGALPAVLLACVVPVTTLLVELPSFADSDREYAALEKLLPEIAVGSAVAPIGLGTEAPARTYSVAPGGGRVLATRGGRMAYAFTYSPISPLVVRQPYQWQGALSRIAAGDLRPDHDLKMFRYVLAHASDPQMARLGTLALADDSTLVDTSGAWLLFESKLPLVPLASPALKMEKPPPESIGERGNRILAEMRGAPPSP